MKRIAIPAVVLFILIALLLRKRKVPSWFYPAVGGFCILFFLAFLYCVRNGIITALLLRFGINMMGRDYLWSMANPYYEFSITYLGHGFEYVDTIIGQWYNAGLINEPFPFHNDILKVFVEVGFPGFLLVKVYFLAYIYAKESYSHIKKIEKIYLSLPLFISSTLLINSKASSSDAKV